MSDRVSAALRVGAALRPGAVATTLPRAAAALAIHGYGSVSIVKLRAGVFSIAPRVVVGERWMQARTHRLWSVLSLFSFERELYVDMNRRQLRLRERRWWRARERLLGIDAIDHIEYRYEGWATSFFTSFRSSRLSLETADRVDRFAVGLVLKNGEHLPLFTFVGEGAAMTGGLGVLLGDNWLDCEGTQEQDARGFIDHLTRLTKLGLGPSLPRQVAERRGVCCPQCGQRNAPRPRCLYCGAALEGGASAAPSA